MSQSALQCPIPENIDYLMPGNFIFSVHKIPQLTFFVQTEHCQIFNWDKQGQKIHYQKYPTLEIKLVLEL